MENEIDLFDDYEALPQDVLDLLEKYEDVESYKGCAKLVAELKPLGYTCEYGLDAVPHSLRKLTEKELAVIAKNKRKALYKQEWRKTNQESIKASNVKYENSDKRKNKKREAKREKDRSNITNGSLLNFSDK
jgi:hypothetical protein